MALTPAGAARVGVREFRTQGANFWLGRPLIHRDFKAWGLPGRKVRVGKEYREWRLGRKSRLVLGRMVPADL